MTACLCSSFYIKIYTGLLILEIHTYFSLTLYYQSQHKGIVTCVTWSSEVGNDMLLVSDYFYTSNICEQNLKPDTCELLIKVDLNLY